MERLSHSVRTASRSPSLFAAALSVGWAAPGQRAEVVWDAPDPNPPEARWQQLASEPASTLSGTELLTVARFHIDRALWPGASDRETRLRSAMPYYRAALDAPGLSDTQRAQARHALDAIAELLGDAPAIASSQTPPQAVISAPDPHPACNPQAGHWPVAHVPLAKPPVIAAAPKPAVSPSAAAIARAVQWLWSRHDPDTQWETRSDDDPHHAAATALALLAFQDLPFAPSRRADHPPPSEAVSRAARALAVMPAHGTFAVALRACALDAHPSNASAATRDRATLAGALNAEGRLGPMTQRPADGATAVHTYAGIAAIGLVSRGDAPASPDTHTHKSEPGAAPPWPRLAAFLVLQQQPDGGFPDPWKPGRTGGEPDAVRFAADPTATVFSLATLAQARAHLATDSRPAADAALRAGLAYLDSHLDPARNPMPGRYHAACDLALLDLADHAGLLTLHGRDLRGAIADRLLARQQPDGSWGGVAETALAMLALRRTQAAPARPLVEVHAWP